VDSVEFREGITNMLGDDFGIIGETKKIVVGSTFSSTYGIPAGGGVPLKTLRGHERRIRGCFRRGTKR